MKRNFTNFEEGLKKGRSEPQENSSRTIYLGGVPASTSCEEIFDNIKGGPVETIRRILEKNCVFVDFMEHAGAVIFYEWALNHKIVIGGSEIKVGWGKPNEIPSNLLMAFQSGASRNVFIGGLDESFTHDLLLEEFGKYGPIDCVRFIKEKKIAFVHFVSTSDALKAVAELPANPRFTGKRVNYGKDRCALQEEPSPVVNMQHQQYLDYVAAQQQAADASTSDPVSDTLLWQQYQQQMQKFLAEGLPRTIYLGGLHPETTAEDLCNIIRGGALHNVKVVPEKRCAFVTFIDPNAASAFFFFAFYQGVVIRGHKLKPGWGKSLPLPSQVTAALQRNATRNVYIGNVPPECTKEKLLEDFGSFGTIESVNLIRQKNIAFVNFTNLLTAVKAVDCIRSDASLGYSSCKVAFGKDRCASIDYKTLLAPLSEKMNQQSTVYYDYRQLQSSSLYNTGDAVAQKPHETQ